MALLFISHSSHNNDKAIEIRDFVLRGHNARTLSLAFSPDSKWLATGNEDRTVRLWSSINDDPSTSSALLNAPVGLCVSFSPNGKRLALNQTEYCANPFSPDSLMFASTDADSELYQVNPTDLKTLACRIAGRNLNADEVHSSSHSQFRLDPKICPLP
ncbi:hypothetical protein [uncultured Rhodoblastus sp.]|uniref:WD40 repeat domain-containing protein n=1 Tax=uncultured Rhodoblastus sp. TaxID=543037 RepID=UPI0025E9C740|nr:hypothetical protein [uncultured Rhodoblastus sp.]